MGCVGSKDTPQKDKTPASPNIKYIKTPEVNLLFIKAAIK